MFQNTRNITNNFQMLFLLGVMRSGTTYFRNILSSNKNIYGFPGELNHFWSKTAKAPCGRSHVCPAMTADDLTSDTANKVRDFFNSKYASRNHPYEILYRFYRKLRFKNECVLKRGVPFYLLNKSTHLINKISYVNAIFPDSKYIFILRDIHSHSNSMKNHLSKIELRRNCVIEYPSNNGECWRFHPSKEINRGLSYSFKDIPTYWIEMNYLALKLLDDIERNRVFYVYFDTLFYHPQSIIAAIGDFLGTEKLNDLFSKDLVNHSTTDPANQWQLDLSKKELSIIDSIIEMHQSNYDFIMNRMHDVFI